MLLRRALGFGLQSRATHFTPGITRGNNLRGRVIGATGHVGLQSVRAAHFMPGITRFKNLRGTVIGAAGYVGLQSVRAAHFTPGITRFKNLRGAVLGAAGFVGPQSVRVAHFTPGLNRGKNMRVAVIGAAGHVGQLISLVLKQSHWVQELALADVHPEISNVCEDLRSVDTDCIVYVYPGVRNIPDAMKDADVVLICSGQPRTGCLTQTDMFAANAQMMFDLVNQFATVSPSAMLCIMTQPTDSLVPLACEVLREKRVLDPNRVFGVTAVDVMRASTLIARKANRSPHNYIVPVIGGHSKDTIVPILSQTKPSVKIPEIGLSEIYDHVRNAPDDVFALSDFHETPGVAPAVAAARFVVAVIRALHGEASVVQCAYIQTKSIPGVNYMALPIELGRYGVKRDFGLPRMSEKEKELYNKAVEELKESITRGEEFVHNKLGSPRFHEPKKRKRKKLWLSVR